MLKVKLHSGQTEVVNDPHRFKVVCAGRRWGKSLVSRMALLKWASEKEGLYWIVSPTFQQGKDIHWFQGFRLEIPKLYIKRVNEADLTLDLSNGSRIQLKSAENPDRLKGVKLNGLIVDEIATMRDWDWVWQEALRPTLTDFSAPAMFISSPKGYNHFYELFLKENQDPQFKSFKFTSYDNPFIPTEELDSARLTLTEDYFAQEYLAEFKTYTGLVYKCFSRLMHVKELPDFKPIYYIRGLDKGFRNPTACALIAVDKDDVWYMIDEVYETGLTNPPLAELLKQQRGELQLEYSTMDSAHASDIQDLQDLGEDFLPVRKQSGEKSESYVRYKIQKLTERIKSGKFIVDPSCEHIVAEFERYRWKEKRSGDANESEVPEKANDHCFTGDTMVLTKRGSIPIRTVVVGDFVWSPFGWNKVYRAGCSGIRVVKDYGVFRCTPDHRIPTSNGIKEVDSLGDSDMIFVCQKPHTLMEFLTAATQIQKTKIPHFILGGLLTKSLVARQDFYTEMYGNTIRAKFLLVFMSIMLTVTLVIMTLAILSLSLLASMQKGIIGVFGRGEKNTWVGYTTLQKNGTHLKRAKGGTPNMVGKPGRTGKLSFVGARSVVKSIGLSLSLGQNIVQGNARLQPKGEEKVYNLATKYGFYFANGVLVSNCLDAVGDLNSMYIYDYQPQKRKKEERLSGTFSPVEETPDEYTFYDEIDITRF